MTIDGGIGRFNQYVKLLVQSLKARNQTTSDLLINLFKGYAAVSDEAFRTWLLRMQDDHEDGIAEINPDELMLAAKNKYDAMVEKGNWNAPSAKEKIVALTAMVKSEFKNPRKKGAVNTKGKKMGGKTAPEGAKSKKKDDAKSGPHPTK
jgi:hypothetical protein